MRFLISGYYGYDNAGDEAVLAALLHHLNAQSSGCHFVVTSGAPSATAGQFAGEGYTLECIPRDDFKAIWQELKACDVFLSGGGSLLQDSTSLRNIIYYTSLIRLAHMARKPAMIYAQGIGPLHRNISRKLTRRALQNSRTRIITLRDRDSRDLLTEIGVEREMEVTADPVWHLPLPQSGDALKRYMPGETPIWCVALRSWPESEVPDAERKVLEHIQATAARQGACLRYLAMQPSRDKSLVLELGVSPDDILDTENRHPSEIMAMAGQCDLMIGMRLHALIFAAAQRIPCIAVSYDPKVASLADIIGAPVIKSAHPEELAKLEDSILTARAPSLEVVEEMQAKARRNAELAVSLGQS